MFEKRTIKVNNNLNIFVGDNDSGKTTLLEVLQIIISGKLGYYSFDRQIKTSYFNFKTREKFINKLTTKKVEIEELPKIILEAYFRNNEKMAEFKGTNNELGNDCPGIRMTLEFNEEYEKMYKDMLSANEISDIPVEFYIAKWRDFSAQPINFRSFPLKISVIDTTKKDYSNVVTKFINSRITSNLSDKEKVNLARAYSDMKQNFNKNENVIKLNERISSEERLNDKKVRFSMIEEVPDAWMSKVSIDVENIPFEEIGFGTQNLIKMDLVLKENTEKANIILFEEPENNLSFGNMSKLISKIGQNNGKQVFISTHSSYVANKLGLKNIVLLYKGKISQLTSVKQDTMNFFKKLPGYNTLRFLLAEKIILVEGPADELIVQKAYKNMHYKLPIEDSVDVIAVGSLAFKRYFDLAVLVKKPLSIITDNDGNIEKNITQKYKNYTENHGDIIRIFYEKNEELSTLEPSIVEVNSIKSEKFDRFKSVISKNNSLLKANKKRIIEYMTKNKVEWALRVFDSDESIEYPEYIKDAIK